MTWQEEQAEIRRDLAMMLEEELRSVCDEVGDGPADPRPHHILDRAIAIVKGEDRGR